MRFRDNQIASFSATTVHLEHITTALQCLTPFGIKEDVLIYIDKDGLSFVRENNHSVKIQLLLSRELFMSYCFDEINGTEDNNDANNMKLCVKINHILDSVNVANRNLDDIVECTLSYDGEGTPFVLIFEDSMISERVEYSTFLIKDMDNSDLQIIRDEIVLECIIKGDVLYSALQDLKDINCKDCYIYAKTKSNGENIFCFVSKSDLGMSKIKLPGVRSILEKLEIYESDFATLCYDVPVIGFFDFGTFDKIRASTKIASKVLFRMDSNGLLSVNILSQTDNVIISDTRNSNRSNSGGAKQLQLPKDYPGIVIEVSILGKEELDEFSIHDVEKLMETKTGTDDKHVENHNIKRSLGLTVNNNLLDLSTDGNSNAITRTDGDSEDENRAGLTQSANDLPLFF
ncbi:hypothetical protein KAFR_0C04940 [Kazachstania africana CBS 2517]|uniref:DNA damage checkpoint control protein RAD17 n=1 Tax=Kazachstania africana (strain ATCC 22294 / BCRC 22015 / CBS 2517 / CECT 1963 / NBRC 1671 / NRRL Y-8276) TaxID=1071382 RepID=H2ASY5_KAZAF|nr:hypothetical protein KAFR_0C04940 [Kazachstania africana CBS 2517]CCF57485.1 hypothetical protein KAFR_0C04940 [Kazachstania africana CBS 2517]